jgi:hypothetical protein
LKSPEANCKEITRRKNIHTEKNKSKRMLIIIIIIIITITITIIIIVKNTNYYSPFSLIPS